MGIEFYKLEIIRAFRVLGPDKGFDQNNCDILSWFSDGYISREQQKQLLQFNRKLWRDLLIINNN